MVYNYLTNVSKGVGFKPAHEVIDVRMMEDKEFKKRSDSVRDWETPAYAGLMFSLADYKDRLEERHGFKLNAKPREIDIRIIDKLSGFGGRMEHDIANKHFREYRNI